MGGVFFGVCDRKMEWELREICAFLSDFRPTPGIDHFQNSDIFDVRRSFESYSIGSIEFSASEKVQIQIVDKIEKKSLGVLKTLKFSGKRQNLDCPDSRKFQFLPGGVVFSIQVAPFWTTRADLTILDIALTFLRVSEHSGWGQSGFPTKTCEDARPSKSEFRCVRKDTKLGPLRTAGPTKRVLFVTQDHFAGAEWWGCS